MPEQMQCMEIWGGNQGVTTNFHRPGLDIWLHSRPYENAANGGDVYYLSSCASGRISRMLLADVCGHGPRVSGIAQRLRDLMRRYVNSISQTRFVEGMNREFVEFNQDGQFATAIVGTFYASTRSFEVSIAGHPRPLLYRQKTGKWELFEVPRDQAAVRGLQNAPLGIFERVEYGQTKVKLAVGDMVLAYTDGLIEAQIGNDRLLETRGLLELVQSLDANKPETLLQDLLGVLAQRAVAPIGDDLSLLLVRADGSRASFWNSLLAPFRLFHVRDRIRFR